jgi:uncharacterized protein
MANAINWFEIPAKDLARAKKFYETILGMTMIAAGGSQSAMFPADWQHGEVGGGITVASGNEPSDKGAVVYLNGGADLGVILDRVEAAGGKVLMPKAKIPGMDDAGYIGMFLDSEGNKLGLHSMG